MNTPAQLGFLFLVMIPVSPGVTLLYWAKFVPMLNIGMVGNQILGKVVEPGTFGVTMAVNTVVAMLCLLVAVRQFGRDEMLYRV